MMLLHTEYALAGLCGIMSHGSGSHASSRGSLAQTGIRQTDNVSSKVWQLQSANAGSVLSTELPYQVEPGYPAIRISRDQRAPDATEVCTEGVRDRCALNPNGLSH